jgi:hypothetical protein
MVSKYEGIACWPSVVTDTTVKQAVDSVLSRLTPKTPVAIWAFAQLISTSCHHVVHHNGVTIVATRKWMTRPARGLNQGPLLPISVFGGEADSGMLDFVLLRLHMSSYHGGILFGMTQVPHTFRWLLMGRSGRSSHACPIKSFS